MGNRIADIGKLRSQVDGENRTAIFDGKKSAKLGTKKNPAVITVQTEKRLKEVTAAFEATGWNYKIRLDPDKPEDIVDLTRLRNPPNPSLDVIKSGLEILSLQHPQAKQTDPIPLVDPSFVRRIDQSGFIAGLYKKWFSENERADGLFRSGVAVMTVGGHRRSCRHPR